MKRPALGMRRTPGSTPTAGVAPRLERTLIRRAATSLTLMAVTLAPVSCSSESADTTPDGSWVGTVTTEDNVTTVVNESGSVWGGTAGLIEEASIGVESGPDEYMLDAVSNVYAADERIYVVNPRIPVVRMYDYDGVFIGNLGNPGQGPGEYDVPVLISVAPDGRRFVYDNITYRINVYAADGTSIDTWPVPNRTFACCFLPMLVSEDGDLWAPVAQWAYQREDEGGGDTRYGLQVFGPEGPEGSPVWQPENFEVPNLVYGQGELERPVPFAPGVAFGVAGVGRMVGGVSTSYRFWIHHADGSILAVERLSDPVPVPPDHAEWRRRRIVARRHKHEGPEWRWDGDDIPAQMPAFWDFVPAASGELWVMRLGPGERLEGCVEDPIEAGYDAGEAAPCWRNTWIIDVFSEDGRYLGEVEAPQGLSSLSLPLRVFVRDRLVLATIEDEAGTIMVKRYRLVLPGEEER